MSIDLQPEKSPNFLRRMVANIDNTTEYAKRLMSARTPQRDAADEAAVLVLFTGADTHDAEVLLTHRTPTMRSHSGQMAFPGGGIEATDQGPIDAALREATEETGLDRDGVIPLAQLTSLTTGGSRRVVRPVVAYAQQPGPTYAASTLETDDVFFSPVSTLLAAENRLRVGFKNWSGPAFRINGYLVWGFTAVILDILFDAAGWNTPYDATIVPLEQALEESRNQEPRYSR